MQNSRDTPTTLAKAVEVQDSRIARIEKCLFANGQPSLEDRVRGWLQKMWEDTCREIKRSADHGKNNTEDGDSLVLREIQHETEERGRQHEENKAERKEDRGSFAALGVKFDTLNKKVDRITNWGAAFCLAFIILKGLEDFGIVKVVSK